MSTVSRTWKDPLTNLDLAAAQKVSEQNWDDAMSDIAYVGNALEPTTLLNKSGGALSLGTVVIIDSGNAGSFTTTTRQGDPRVLGVVMEASIASNGSGRVAALGPVATVNVQGNVAIGDFLECSTTVGRARSNGAAKTPGTFAIATSAYSGGSAGTVSAVVLPGCSAGAILAGSSIMLLLPHSGSSASTVNPTSTNQVRAIRVTIPVGLWVNSIAFDVQTAEAGKFMGVGIYTLDGNTKLIDSGALSVAATGVKSTTLGSTFYLPPGQYWLAYTSDTGGATLQVYSVLNPNNSAMDNTGTTPLFASAANGGSAGVLPATLGALTGINQGQMPLARLAG